MSNYKDMPEHENISDMLDEIKRSYGASDSEYVADAEPSFTEDMSEEELKARLRMQFMSSEKETASSETEDSYFIDEEFLAEARMEGAEEDIAEESVEISEVAEEEPTEDEAEERLEISEFIKEEPAEEEESFEISEFAEDLTDDDDDITFDQLVDIEEDDGIVLTHLEVEEDEDITFDELVDIDEDDGIVLTHLEVEEDDDVTFDQLENEEEDDGVVFTRLEIEDVAEEPLAISQEIESNEEVIADMQLDHEMLDAKEVEELVAEAEDCAESVVREEWAGPKIPVTLFPEVEHIQDTGEPEVVATENVEVTEETEELLLQDVSVQETAEEAPAELDTSEISLLMQFGCDDEVLNRSTEEGIRSLAEEEHEEVEHTKSEKPKNEKIFERYEAYRRTRGALLVKLGLCSLLAFVLLIYEGLPEIFGVEFAGILNREEYFTSYALLGLQCAVLCGVLVYMQVWDGMKKLFSRNPNVYSMISVFAVVTLIYDIVAIFVDGATPPTFHFLLALSILVAILWEYQRLVAERRCFEFYFSDVLFGREEVESGTNKKFTLCRSTGAKSSAEKMYAGGLDSSKNVFFPIEAESSLGFFSAAKSRAPRNGIPAFLLVPVIAFSFIAGIIALVLSEQVWIGLAAVEVSLFMCMPIVWTVSKWLPFERVSAVSASDGYSFANDECMEHYADCDIAIFNDMHLFAKCSPAAVNLLLYDATSKEVLLGCLNSVYSKIGGPMGDTFKAAQGPKFNSCNITRIARSGVEAIVGNSYSVLLGSEAFMLRYGISFPKAELKDQADEIFTLCVSINGRVSARIAVKYAVNEVFEMLISRLAEDDIQCAIETFDPMINAQMLTRVREGAEAPINIVHLGVQDFISRQDPNRDKLTFNASGEKLGVIAEGSRFNLAIALSTAKQMRKLNNYTGALSIGVSGLGAIITLLTIAFGVVDGFSQFFILLYWMLSAGGIVGLIFKFLPSRDRFSLDRYKQDKKQKEEKRTSLKNE